MFFGSLDTRCYIPEKQVVLKLEWAEWFLGLTFRRYKGILQTNRPTQLWASKIRENDKSYQNPWKLAAKIIILTANPEKNKQRKYRT